MGHLGNRSYRRLAQRLGQYVPGTYASDTLIAILRQLVSEEEARLCALLPLQEVPAEDIARLWKKSLDQTRERLVALAGRGVVCEFTSNRGKTYVLAPPVLGFFEFSLMRPDGKLDSAALARLYHQYCNIEGDFIAQQGAAHPALARVYAHEDLLGEVVSEVLTQDRVSAGIDAASCITVGMCYCRHKMQHLGQACAAPMDVCLTFNQVARYLADHGIARVISRDEAHRIVRDCMAHGLVQIGDNTRSGLAVICNCCGCCCDLLLGYKRFGGTGLVSASAFVAVVDPASCSGCGTCAERCPVAAITPPRGAEPKTPGSQGLPTVDPAVCLGCGVCARFCPSGACRLANRPVRPEVPEDLVEKITLAAIDAGKLGNYLFDDQTSQLHGLLRRLVNLTLELPLVKRFLLWRPVRRRVVQVARGTGRVTQDDGPPLERPAP